MIDKLSWMIDGLPTSALVRILVAHHLNLFNPLIRSPSTKLLPPLVAPCLPRSHLSSYCRKRRRPLVAVLWAVSCNRVTGPALSSRPHETWSEPQAFTGLIFFTHADATLSRASASSPLTTSSPRSLPLSEEDCRRSTSWDDPLGRVVVTLNPWCNASPPYFCCDGGDFQFS